MIKSYLLAPGPTPVPPEVQAAIALPLIHHRTPQFGAVLAEVSGGAARALRHPPRTSSSSPHPVPARWRAAVTNLLLRPATRSSSSTAASSASAGRRSPRPTASRSTRSRSSGGGPSTPAQVRGRPRRPSARAGGLPPGERDLDLRAPPGRRDRRVDAPSATRCWWSTASPRSASSTLPMDRSRHRRPDHGLPEGADAAARPGVRRALAAGVGGDESDRVCRASTSTSRRERKGVAKKSTAWTPAISLIQGLRVALADDACRRGGRPSTRVTIAWRVRRGRDARRWVSVCSPRRARARR